MLISPFCENQLLGFHTERCHGWCHDGGWPGHCCMDQGTICPCAVWADTRRCQCKPCPVAFRLNAGHFAPPDPLSRQWTARFPDDQSISFPVPLRKHSAPSTLPTACPHICLFLAHQGASFSWRRGMMVSLSPNFLLLFPHSHQSPF